MGGACSTNEEERNANRIFVGRPEGKRLLIRRRLMSADNIKMDLGEMEWGAMEWVYLAQDRDWFSSMP
jgi:hypothetical protein